MKKMALAGIFIFISTFTVFIVFAYAPRMGYVYEECDIDVYDEHSISAHDAHTTSSPASFPQEHSVLNCWWSTLYQPVPAYSPGVYKMEITGERVSAREWYAHHRQLYEYLSQYGEPHFGEICDDLQYLIDTDGYLYVATFPFHLCPDEGRLIALEQIDESADIATLSNLDGSPITMRQLIAEPHLRARDGRYLSDAFPYILPSIYISEDMWEQQRRVAEISFISRDCMDLIERMDMQLIISSLELDISRELDEVDAFLIDTFSIGSVVVASFDNTPLMESPGFIWLDYPQYQYRNFRGHLAEGTKVEIVISGTPVVHLGVSTDVNIPIRIWHYVEVLEGDYYGRTGWIPNFLLNSK